MAAIYRLCFATPEPERIHRDIEVDNIEPGDFRTFFKFPSRCQRLGSTMSNNKHVL